MEKKTLFKLEKVKGVRTKELSIADKIMRVFQLETNKGQLFGYLEMYKAVDKIFPGTFKGKTPEYTVSATLSVMAGEGKIKVARPSFGKSRYYV